MTIQLTPELERRLAQEAERQGINADDYALRALDKQLEQDRRAAAIAVLRSFREGDAEEQRETGEYLIRALDEDRLSDRKLFPPELKGKTW